MSSFQNKSANRTPGVAQTPGGSGGAQPNSDPLSSQIPTKVFDGKMPWPGFGRMPKTPPITWTTAQPGYFYGAFAPPKKVKTTSIPRSATGNSKKRGMSGNWARNFMAAGGTVEAGGKSGAIPRTSRAIVKQGARLNKSMLKKGSKAIAANLAIGNSSESYALKAKGKKEGKLPKKMRVAIRKSRAQKRPYKLPVYLR